MSGRGVTRWNVGVDGYARRDAEEFFCEDMHEDRSDYGPEKLPPISGPVEPVTECHKLPAEGDGYDSLRHVLEMAVEQASGGKGKERHANGQPFERQPICEGGRRFGPKCLMYQAWKKSHESPVLLEMEGGKDRAVRELLGVINYAAAAIIVIREAE